MKVNVSGRFVNRVPLEIIYVLCFLGGMIGGMIYLIGENEKELVICGVGLCMLSFFNGLGLMSVGIGCSYVKYLIFISMPNLMNPYPLKQS